MDYDSASNMKAVSAIAPASVSTDQLSSALDTSLYGYKALTLEVYVGVGGITFDGSNYIAINVTHLDTDSNYAAVTDDDVILPYSTTATVALMGASDGTVKLYQALHAAADITLIGYRGKKRYVKVEADFIGTHGSPTVVGVNWIFDNPMSAPTWQTSVTPDVI
jgi:hypothetical protein